MPKARKAIKQRSQKIIKVNNSLTGRLQPLVSGTKPISIYVCGVTVYDYSHIGHARTIIVFDVLRRYLLQKGYKLLFVQNFTDVDDKIINRARELGVPPRQVAQKFIDQYFSDFDSLNVLRADFHPKPTEHIAEIQAVIAGLIQKGFAYRTPSGVYFDVSEFDGYGKLSKKSTSQLIAGARVEVDPTKKDPLDFALWKVSDDEPNWDSPWGTGRPGWHIECSAMSLKYLGETFDVHGGGQDLIFPHHENEIAQSEAYTGKNFVRIWMHVGLVNIAGARMAKSLRNYVPIHEALRKCGPNVIRLYAVLSHYRSPVEFAEQAFDRTAQLWHLIENAVAELQSSVGGRAAGAKKLRSVADAAYREFDHAMKSDLNTPIAVGALMKLVKLVNRTASEGKLTYRASKAVSEVLGKIMWVFGLQTLSVTTEEKQQVERLVGERNQLRRLKKFSEADEVRETLRKRGIELVDYPNRTVWRKTSILSD